MAKSIILAGCVAPSTQSQNLTEYWTLIGYGDRTTIVANREMPIQKHSILTRFRAQITSNTVSLASELDILIDSTPIAMDISVPANTSGTYETVGAGGTINAGSDISLRVVPGSGSTGTLRITYTSIICEPDDASTVTTSFYGVSHPTSRPYSTASTTYFFELNGYLDVSNTTEAASQYEMRVSGTFKRWSIYVPSNSRTTATTAGLRKNGVNQTSSISVGNLASGWFEDLTNTVSVVANDLICWRLTTGTGTPILSLLRANVEFEMTGVVQMVLMHNQVLGATARNVSRFYAFSGYSDEFGVIGDTQYDLPVDAVARNLGARIQANSVAAASSIFLQKNGVDTALVVSIPSLGSGWLEDTTNSVTLVAEDLLNYRMQTGGGSGSQTLTLRSIGVHLDMPIPSVTMDVTASSTITNKFITKV